MTRPDRDVPHRKNAAEWAMWLLLQPVRWLLLCRAHLTAIGTRHEGGPDGRA